MTTMCECLNCKCSFKKKYQGNVSNKYCCADCRNNHIVRERVESGNYTRANAITYHKRFTKYECSCCKISEWQGQALTLQIDHIDGNNKNNLVENLRYLCPNCHTQTDTWGVKNAAFMKMGNQLSWESTCFASRGSAVRTRYSPPYGPFVYRLGRQVFNLERGVRFPYGLPSYK